MKPPIVHVRGNRFASVALALILVGTACAHPPDRSPEGQVFRVASWSELQVVHSGLVDRLDGVVAGAFTEKVAELFAEQWQLFDEYAQLSARHKVFATDVMAALNEAVPAVQAAQIVSNARTRCPSKHTALCGQILDALVPKER